VDVGANVLVGTGSQRIIDVARKMIDTREACRILLARVIQGRELFQIWELCRLKKRNSIFMQNYVTNG